MILKLIMNDYIARLLNVYKDYLRVEETINKRYCNIHLPEGQSKYSDKYIEECLEARNVDLKGVKAEYQEKVKSAEKEALEAIKPNMEIIGSSDYQVRLSNTLNLLSLSNGDIDISLLEFIGEARDASTLKIIADKYSNMENGKLIQFAFDYDVDRRIERIKKFSSEMVANIEGELSDAFKENIVQTLKESSDY